MLRLILSVLTVCFALFAALIVVNQPAAWPILLIAGLLLIGIVFEQLRYRGRALGASGGTWNPTSERFFDDASGRPVTVWFNATTGERLYVEDGEAARRIEIGLFAIANYYQIKLSLGRFFALNR